MKYIALLLLVSCAPRPVATNRATAVRASALTGSVNVVTDCGAVGDDIVDDRPAIQTCLSSGATDILVPNGTYLVSNGSGSCDLVAPSGVTIHGESRDGAVLKQMAGQPASVRLLGFGTCQSNPPAVSDVTIRDLTLDGNKAAQTVDEHRSGIFARNAPNLRIERVTARNFTGDGFYIYDRSNGPTVIDVLATGNDRDGIVFGGGTSGGSVTGSTFSGNAKQQFDTEGGAVNGLVVMNNVIDGTGSNDYAMTATGGSATNRSTGWLISGNVITGGLELLWIDSSLVTLNRGVNPTTKPAITLWRTTHDIALTGNDFTNTDTLQANNAIVYIAGTGVGSATYGFKAQGNTWTARGHPTVFAYRIEGAVSVEIWEDTMIGTGIAAAGSAGIWARATSPTEDFQLLRVGHSTFRNWGSVGIEITGNGTARLDVFESIYNAFDDTTPTGTMKVAISPDLDHVHAAKDVRIVASALTGWCVTPMGQIPIGALSAWGDRWMQ